MKRKFFCLLLLAGLAVTASAHFVFIVPGADGTNAKVFLSEDLKPDSAVGIDIVSGAKLSLRSGAGTELPLTLVKGSDAYSIAITGAIGTRVIHGSVDLGLSSEGSKKQYILVYHPKAIIGNAFDEKALVGGETPVEIVPLGKSGALKLRLLVHGKPQANSEITVILPDGSQKKMTTDASGETETLAQSGRYGAWARYWETNAGERDGKKYDEVRHYATLVADTLSADKTADSTTAKSVTADPITAKLFAKLPEETSSFGAVVSDGWLYVYGGHVARTHSYSSEAVSGKFARLKLADKTWEQLPEGPKLQGMNLAAHRGKIYLIGGMTPQNNPGEKADNQSVVDNARFDPATKKWEALPPLPQPRSSHDVVVIGDKLVVAGGWTLRGNENEWMETVLTMDLNAKTLEWKSAKQPFKRRALIAAAHNGKMYVIGGFNEKNQIVREISIYDPKTDTWSEGPKMPEGRGLAFAPAASVNNGSLYVSVSDGSLYRLKESTQEWEKVGRSTPRLAHRMVSWEKSVLVIGGADKGKNSDLVESIAVE